MVAFLETWKRAAMIRTHTIRCRIPREVADLLNLASGRIYTGVLVAHYRVRRRKDKDGTVERIAVKSGQPIPRVR